MTDTFARAKAEQEAAAADVPEGAPLYTEAEAAQYALAALHLRHAAVSLEAVAVATDVRLARAHLAGAYKFIKEGRKLLADAVDRGGNRTPLSILEEPPGPENEGDESTASGPGGMSVRDYPPPGQARVI